MSPRKQWILGAIIMVITIVLCTWMIASTGVYIVAGLYAVTATLVMWFWVMKPFKHMLDER